MQLSEAEKLENWETVENRLQPVAQLRRFHLSADEFPSVTSRQILAIQRRVAVSRPNVQSFEQHGLSTIATRGFIVSIM